MKLDLEHLTWDIRMELLHRFAAGQSGAIETAFAKQGIKYDDLEIRHTGERTEASYKGELLLTWTQPVIIIEGNLTRFQWDIYNPPKDKDPA